MNKQWFFAIIVLLFSSNNQAQITDSIFVQKDSLVIMDTIPEIVPENLVGNPKAIAVFFQKLINLQKSKSGKINIVHIGDSHIQADLMTNITRKNLQSYFGNAGRGLLFPHSLAKTNGTWDVKFSSNANWSSYRNVSPVNGTFVGLSGIALTSKTKDFYIQMTVKDSTNFFNTIKFVTPYNQDLFSVSTEKRIIATEVKVPKKINHKIKRGEVISKIADKYNVSISEIKKANGLKSNNIRAGKTLRIPTSEMEIKTAEKSEFIPLTMFSETSLHLYKSENQLDKIFIVPNKTQNEFVLNGIILENNNAGILYHNIGVNGAKFSDYNKYPLFFEQLKSLNPDLVIVSLGTNESFDKMKSEDYMVQLDLFLQNIKNQNPETSFLIATPPPSYFERKFPNIFVADYAQKISNLSVEKNYAFWDMYSQLGGLYGVDRNYRKGLMANDKVHYSKQGYEFQGNLLYEAILKAYNVYNNPQTSKN